MKSLPILVRSLTVLFMLELKGTGAKVINSAINKTVTMSNEEWPGTFTVDGDVSTNQTECQCCARTQKQDNPWLRVDLGRKHRVVGVVIYGRTDLTNNTVQNFDGMKIYLHDDEGSLTQAVDTIPDNVTSRFHNTSLVTPVIARYVTVQLGSDKRLVVCEVQVFTEGTNVALNKTVTISLGFPNANFDPSHAVDGKLLGSPNSGTCGCCAATGTMWNPWIRVDLGGVFRIFILVVYGRTNTKETFDKMNIYLHLSEGDKGNATRTYPTSDVFITETFDPDILARYVTLQQMGYLLTVYCEIEVYGECPSGTFWPNCSTCHCDGSPCDIWEGVCPSGICLPGYRGVSCDTACINGTYGQNCSKTCGNCLDMKPCNHVDGSCELCAAGYTGTLCTNACSNRTFGLNCSKQCGQCFENKPCNVTSGYCDGICAPGYNGSYCNISCPGGRFGHNCNESCGNCLNNVDCDSVSGNCNLCKAGFHGQLCKTQCSSGTFGLNCSGECGNCRSDERCDVISGNCTNGCTAGYQGIQCKSNCSEGTFGLDCSGTCHCKDNVTCNHVTGRCPSGECESGWIGRNCSRRTNIALNKDVEMSSTDDSGDKAVDGRLPGEKPAENCDCCATTPLEMDPWLRVDLGTEFRLFTVTVYGRNRTEDVTSQLNISIESEKDIAEYTRIFESPSVITNVSFEPPVKGRYIFIQQASNVMAYFCEVEVFGECSSGTFGPNCTTCHCNGSQCDIWDGVCPSGKCLPGYRGESCDRECDDMKYGQNCSQKCGKCFDGQACDYVNGRCKFCEPGYMGDLCKTECTVGRYGQNCSGTCPNCNGGCDHVSGICLNGCQDGYKGEKCEEQCPYNTYGKNCSYQCGNCLTTCNHVNGSCDKCSPGYTYTDMTCKTECDEGKYGPNCSKKCGFCSGGKPCNISSGQCVEGCLAGYNGTFCNETCVNGTYGNRCVESCGHCFGDRICDTTNGSCGGQCEDGYIGDNCKQVCDDYKYGHNCDEQCGHCKENVTCDKVNGTCKQCEPGFENDMFCKTNCASGYFGLNCSHQCGYCNGNCNIKTGSCHGGCLDGYQPADRCIETCFDGTYGKNCSNRCHCLNNVTCQHKTGHCPNNACSFGWIGEVCNRSTNVALGKTVSLSSQFDQYFKATYAVDGKLPGSLGSNTCKCCAATKKQWNPVIRVDLGGVFRIFTLLVHGRTAYGETFNNMNIYLHLQEGDWGNATKTYPTSGTFINETFDPDIQARYVTLQQMGNLLTVYCEVEVYGECPSGKFGSDCRTCHCDGSPCDVWDGVCPSGICLSGYRGVSCDKACSNLTYGKNCSGTCGACMDNETCDNVNGRCTMCKPGYTGDLCDTECKDRTYGINCSKQCGKCYDDEQCNVFTGECMGQCAPGYRGRFCNLTCSEGAYGQNCSNTCGSCFNNTHCNVVNGECDECDPGYKDQLCKTACNPGTFGIQCQHTCGQCSSKDSCNATSGNCDQGCAAGYKGIKCNEACQDGMFGFNCSQNCPPCLEGQPCNKVSGKCSECPLGRDGDDCSKECSNMTFGSNCKKKCGHCWNKAECNKRSGECPNGCSAHYTGVLCKDKIIFQPQPPPPEGNSGAVAGIIVTLLLVIAIAGLTGFFLIRRKRMSKPLLPPELVTRFKSILPKRRESTTGLVNGFNMSVREKGEKASKQNHKRKDYDNIQTEIQLTNLWDFINLNKANENDFFQKEFKNLKEGLIHKCNAAQLLEHAGKNRYKGLCAYDHSRVILVCENENEVDYINANFINGFRSEKKFIASQGPTKAMIQDFWRMIWQQEVDIVVMLTNLIELGVKKCVQYWPEDVEANFGNIHVTLIKTDSFKDYDVRLMEIKKEGALYETTRVVTQYHFRAWPDKDVPRTTWCLVNFWRTVDYAVRNSKSKRPVVVHCSAGIGRTGTFLALDILYYQAISEGRIDVFGNVATLRDQRVKMVQTLDQYVYLHEAVADAVLFGTHPFYSEQIEEVCVFMNQKDKSNQSGYDVQLRRIDDSIRDSKEENLYMNAEGNADTDVGRCNGGFMPFDKLELPGCSSGNVFVTSRAPTNDTLPEMWTFILERNIRTIIMLTDKSHPQYKIHQSLGTDSGLTFANMNLRFAEETEHQNFIERQFQIAAETEKMTLMVFEFMAWKENSMIPHNMQALIDMLCNVVLWQPQFSKSEPVYIFCENGALKSGLVCVLLNELERIRFHNSMINIVESVKTMKERNKNVIPNAEQLKFCYEAVQLYVQQNDQYANV